MIDLDRAPLTDEFGTTLREPATMSEALNIRAEPIAPPYAHRLATTAQRRRVRIAYAIIVAVLALASWGVWRVKANEDARAGCLDKHTFVECARRGY